MKRNECLPNTEENREKLYDMGWTMLSQSTLKYPYITTTESRDPVFQGLGRVSPQQIEVPKGYTLYVFESRANKMLKAIR